MTQMVNLVDLRPPFFLRPAGKKRVPKDSLKTLKTVKDKQQQGKAPLPPLSRLLFLTIRRPVKVSPPVLIAPAPLTG